LLFFLSIGIISQYYIPVRLNFLLLSLLATSSLFILCFFIPEFYRFKYNWLKGILVCSMFFFLGSILSFYNNCLLNNKSAIYNEAKKYPIIVTLNDNAVEKQKSYKVEAWINSIYKKGKWENVEGKILLYFNKEVGDIDRFTYGKQLLIHSGVTEIINAGNPGGFNYAQFSFFKNIQYQAFLKSKNFTLLPYSQVNYFKQFILTLRNKTLAILRQNIHSKTELSIAEALLIGYREDLDRDIVKAYSNTGVVHIIAISGLHIGMIYGLLLFLFKPFNKFSKVRLFIKPLFIILILWLFTCIAGMAPSIMRSAIMFSVIALGECLDKRNNIYNNLCLSALIILCINPFSLWDVGFQLSYSAVLSIVLFSKHINAWFYSKWKLIKLVWQLCSITLAAQLLTLPFVLYHFHQFPTLFFITNLLAVPLSGIVLYAELLLLLVSSITTIASVIGVIIKNALTLLNTFIFHINSLNYVVIDNIQVSIVQAVLLAIFILSICYWFINKKKSYLFVSLGSMLVFTTIRAINFYKHQYQDKIIIYNIPNFTAIDVVKGNTYQFFGDSAVNNEGFLRNFHIKPSRTLNRLYNEQKMIDENSNAFIVNNKTILKIDKPINQLEEKIKVDYVLLSKNPKLYITKLAKSVSCKKIIIDGSNPTWKVKYWMKDCDSLGIAYHYTAINGAFILQ
jgi:competence protein ComEC